MLKKWYEILRLSMFSISVLVGFIVIIILVIIFMYLLISQ